MKKVIGSIDHICQYIPETSVIVKVTMKSQTKIFWLAVL